MSAVAIDIEQRVLSTEMKGIGPSGICFGLDEKPEELKPTKALGLPLVLPSSQVYWLVGSDLVKYNH